MFTAIDKALVAVVMGVLYLLNTFTGLSLPFLDVATVTSVIVFLTPVLVYFFPNKTD